VALVDPTRTLSYIRKFSRRPPQTIEAREAANPCVVFVQKNDVQKKLEEMLGYPWIYSIACCFHVGKLGDLKEASLRINSVSQVAQDLGFISEADNEADFNALLWNRVDKGDYDKHWKLQVPTLKEICAFLLSLNIQDDLTAICIAVDPLDDNEYAHLHDYFPDYSLFDDDFEFPEDVDDWMKRVFYVSSRTFMSEQEAYASLNVMFKQYTEVYEPLSQCDGLAQGLSGQLKTQNMQDIIVIMVKHDAPLNKIWAEGLIGPKGRVVLPFFHKLGVNRTSITYVCEDKQMKMFGYLYFISNLRRYFMKSTEPVQVFELDRRDLTSSDEIDDFF